MKLRYISDLHTEHCDFILPVEDDPYEPSVEEEEVLIIAGDIGEIEPDRKGHKIFLENVCSRFKAVIYVLGNHEFYHGDIVHSVTKLRARYAHLENLIILDTESIVIEDVAIIGATLWTKIIPQFAAKVEARLNDYAFIKYDGEALTTDKVVELHEEQKKFIYDSITKFRNDPNIRKVVVVSHHAPTLLSITPMWAGHELNSAYASNLMEEIKQNPPDLWFHGHIHENLQYDIGIGKVICNPRGDTEIIKEDEFKRLWKYVENGGTPKLNVYDYMLMYKHENHRFDPWASKDI